MNDMLGLEIASRPSSVIIAGVPSGPVRRQIRQLAVGYMAGVIAAEKLAQGLADQERAAARSYVWRVLSIGYSHLQRLDPDHLFAEVQHEAEQLLDRDGVWPAVRAAAEEIERQRHSPLYVTLKAGPVFAAMAHLPAPNPKPLRLSTAGHVESRVPLF